MTARRGTPVVTVIMPVFNSSQFLAEAIESALSQTLTDLELLLVDDGSTDESLSIAARYEREDCRIRVLRNPHEGLSRARNRGVGAARGEFLAMLDSDDVALPDRIGWQHAYLVGHPECVVVGGQVQQVDPDGSPIAPLPVCLHHHDITTQLLQGRGSAIVQPAAMFRRSAVLAAGGYDERLDTAEDLDLYLKLSERGTLANLPELLLRYRRHPSSLTAGYGMHRAFAVKQDVIRRAYRRRGWDERQMAVRPFYEPQSLTGLYVAWIAAAMRAGNYTTARKYLRRLLREHCRHPSTSITRMCEAWRQMAQLCLRRAGPWRGWRRGRVRPCDTATGSAWPQQRPAQH
jgi:glycosyltransferase involved in cell wall biosynthesis